MICGKDTSELNDTEYKALWQIAKPSQVAFGDEGLPIDWKFNQADNLFDVGIGKTPPRKRVNGFLIMQMIQNGFLIEYGKSGIIYHRK